MQKKKKKKKLKLKKKKKKKKKKQEESKKHDIIFSTCTCTASVRHQFILFWNKYQFIFSYLKMYRRKKDSRNDSHSKDNEDRSTAE